MSMPAPVPPIDPADDIRSKAVHAKAIALGKLAIRATTSAGSGHPTTALSLAHLVTVLMYGVMRWDPARPTPPVPTASSSPRAMRCPSSTRPAPISA